MKYYLIMINFLSFFLYGFDKKLSEKHKYRISEHNLLLTSFLGGGIGSLISMHLFHHKTLKTKFNLLVPFSIILWIIIYYFVQKYLNFS